MQPNKKISKRTKRQEKSVRETSRGFSFSKDTEAPSGFFGTDLSDTTLATHKDPLQALLIDDIFQRRLGKVGIVNVNVRHVDENE
jgi:hypothetical protein